MILILCEWIAAILSVVGAILVAWNTDGTRYFGFRVWIVSNFFWIIFGIEALAYGVVLTFVVYMVCNVIAVRRNGHEYQEMKCACGHSLGVFTRVNTPQVGFVVCPCGRRVYYECTD